MTREWRRETDKGYATILESVGTETETYGDGAPTTRERVTYFVREYYRDGSSNRNPFLSWSPTLAAAKRQFREWGHSTGKGRWIQS